MACRKHHASLFDHEVNRAFWRSPLRLFVLAIKIYLVEVVVFSDLYANAVDLLFEDSAVLIQGQVQKDENSVKIIADQVVGMEKAEDTWTAAVHIHLDATQTDRDLIVRLREVLGRHQGGCQTYLHLTQKDVSETVLRLPESLRLRAGNALRRDVFALVGYNAVDTICSAATVNGNGNGGGYRGRAT